jgi:histidine triad (HIT) family protein
MQNDCIFCKIAAKQLPADIIYEDPDFVVFKDIYPKAKTHLLIIPKKHIASLNELTEADQQLMGKLILLVPKIANDAGLDTGYRTIFNTGPDGGQEIYHLHAHILGDK